MTFPVRLATLCLLVLAPVPPALAADACDALTARMIRATGASLAGRDGSRAVFRAADAERMSLDCRAPRRMVFAALAREPGRPFYGLIGLAAQALTGASAEAVETLALALHQEALLTGRPRQGRAGRAALRCETAPDTDPFVDVRTRCILVPSPALRRRAGLFAAAGAG
ncbi:hypothetical protein [Methylobacterium sp. J-068]|uniref:hypothetical protein n=1 Tax=Methylobacterium sp. J-068 TaxID=2836649 RepID=UPI001FBB6398|nr:hypothetical protein [Methylobacterium sp. J-068]MCJ2032827.1 hypothetical protein [Methylobacterium sp. J-068]